MKKIIFGAGYFGKQALDFIGKENVKFFIDNSVDKQQVNCLGLKVFSLNEALLQIDASPVIIAVSDKYVNDIKNQLDEAGIVNYEIFAEFKFRSIKERLLRRTDYISVYKRAVAWICCNSVDKKGIINNSCLTKPYPEVTGYYIPTLMRWGYKELAITYAKWLCNIQSENGAWYDTEGQHPYIFDSAQILKGLIAIRNLCPDVDKHIIRGCDWILGNMTPDGRLISPIKEIWGDGKTCSELIHTYCISPIKEAGELFNRVDYIEKAEKIACYYTTKCRNQILKFDLLSHFYAYVMEAMLDIGEVDLARDAMSKMAELQKENGAVPAYNNVDWVCSTGLFQLAVVWFRLGDMEHGNKAFEYACKLQNESGGWYGSYLSEANPYEVATYFPNAEISWAIKYFLDALYYKNITQFENQAHLFCSSIDKSDGRYVCVKNVLEDLNAISTQSVKVLDMGCGKGRYLINLIEDLPDNIYYASDLSVSVMQYIQLNNIEKKKGSLTDIPFENDYFDMVYTCEALEHAVDVKNAVKELCRVVRSGGKIVIIDKNKDMLGYFEIENWEQWFAEDELKEELLKYCSVVDIKKDVNFDDTPANGLFYCWIGTIK